MLSHEIGAKKSVLMPIIFFLVLCRQRCWSSLYNCQEGSRGLASQRNQILDHQQVWICSFLNNLTRQVTFFSIPIFYFGGFYMSPSTKFYDISHRSTSSTHFQLASRGLRRVRDHRQGQEAQGHQRLHRPEGSSRTVVGQEGGQARHQGLVHQQCDF